MTPSLTEGDCDRNCSTRIPAAHGILWENPSDTGSFGWAVLGFFIPLVGLILWMIWKNDRPGDAGMAGKGALVSVIINVVLFILWIVFAGILFAASGSY